MDRDNTIIQMLEESGGMIYNFARNRELDYDDIKQEAALIMLEVWDKIPKGHGNIKAYLHRCIRSNLKKWHKHVIDELELSLNDAIGVPDTRQEQDTARADSITETVHNALRDLMIEEQGYAVKAFGINDFTPVAPEKMRSSRMKPYRFPLRRGEESNIRRNMLRALRKNPHMQALLPA